MFFYLSCVRAVCLVYLLEMNVSDLRLNSTRMHSSRKRTVRCSGHHWEGVSAGGFLPRGVSADTPQWTE